MNTFLKNYLTKASYCLATGFLLGTAFTGSANALTQTGNIAVSASVVAACSITVAPVPFGPYTGSAITRDVSNGVSVTCTNGAPYNIGLSAGGGSGATVITRKLTGSGTAAANTLTYSLYKDSGYVNIWGNTTGNDTQAGTGNGAAQSYTVYGKMNALGAQTLATGSYSDTVIATITY